MTLIKTSLLNAIAVAIRMLTMLGINKILAIYVGPSGYAALGQFQNAVQMISTFGSGAINTGVTKYTAEYQADEGLQHKTWQTAGAIALIGSIITGGCVALFNQKLASWFLKDASYGSVFIWFGLTLVLYVFNTLLLAILNGKKEISRYVVINITGSIFSLAVSIIMIIQFGLYGALLTLAINQSLVFFVTIFLCRRTSWFKFKYLIGGIDKAIAVNLTKYTTMALISAIVVPISHILVRNHLGATFGWDAAGYWEAIWRLSGAYLMLMTTTLSVYFLPRFSELSNSLEIKNEIINGYKVIMPVTIVISLCIYFFRDSIIRLLFTEDFSPMRDLFAWQMLGDIFKVASWIISYVMLGRAMMKLFIISEIFFGASFVFFTYILSQYTGIVGVTIAHAINYAFYLFFMMFFVLKRIVNK